MLNDINFIRKINPLPYSKYENISSREKLVVYTMAYLEKNSIPILFNYVCVASYKLFPEKFHLGDFKEYPHIEMLNRSILHLRPKEYNYAEGRVSTGYRITDLGYQTAEDVEKIIRSNGITKHRKKTTSIDQNKKTVNSIIKRVENSQIFHKWEKEKNIDDNDLWIFFDTTPYSKIEYIKETIIESKIIARQTKKQKVLKFLECLEDKLNNLL